MLNILRAMMPVEVAVAERREEKIETFDDLKKGLERIGLRFEDLRPYKFHTPEQILQLTAQDVTDENENENK